MQADTAFHDIDLSALAPTGDALLGELNQLREHDPLYWSAASHCWIVSGHTEVTEGFSGVLPLSSTHIPKSLYRSMPPEELNARLPTAMRYMPRIVTNLDGAEHAHLRKLLVKALNRKLVEGLRPYVRERASMLLQTAAESGEANNQRAIETISMVMGMTAIDHDIPACTSEGIARNIGTIVSNCESELTNQ